MLTAETLAELRRLLDECQPGNVIVNDLRLTHNAIWLDSRYRDGTWEVRRTLAEIDTETETIEAVWTLDDAILIAGALNALPALLDAAAERDALRAERDALLAIIDDARHALSADGPKVEPARQVLARALPQITAWQGRKRRDRDITPPHVIAHRGAQLDAVSAERDALAAMLAGRCLSDITHRDEERRQSVCMLPVDHAPLAHDDCLGCTWTDADHWEPSAADRVADEVARIADESQHEDWDSPRVRSIVGRIRRALDGADR